MVGVFTEQYSNSGWSKDTTAGRRRKALRLYCRFGFAIQIIYPGIYNPKSSKRHTSVCLYTFICVFWGRHMGLRPTWNYLTFKQSFKSFNPKNHSSDNIR